MITNFLLHVRESSQGRSWVLRTILWCGLAYLFCRHLRDPEYGSIFEGLNLGIHEFGHLICMPFGQWIGVAGGSAVQCLVPVISLFMFHRQEDYFAFAFSFIWLGTNLYGVSRYIGDATVMILPLVTPFGGGEGEVIHDWHYLLKSVDLLAWDRTLAAATSLAGSLSMSFGLAWGLWILWIMMRSPRDVPRFQ